MAEPRSAPCRKCRRATPHTLLTERNPETKQLIRFRVCTVCETKNALGVCCPACFCQRLKVKFGRPRLEATVRQKACKNCGKRFRTREVIESVAS